MPRANFSKRLENAVTTKEVCDVLYEVMCPPIKTFKEFSKDFSKDVREVNNVPEQQVTYKTDLSQEEREIIKAAISHLEKEQAINYEKERKFCKFKFFALFSGIPFLVSLSLILQFGDWESIIPEGKYVISIAFSSLVSWVVTAVATMLNDNDEYLLTWGNKLNPKENSEINYYKSILN